MATPTTKDFVARAQGWWDAAEKAASGEQLDHVKRSRLQYTYLAQSVNYSSQKNTAAWKKANQQLLDDIKKYNVRLREHEEGSINNVDVNTPPDRLAGHLTGVSAYRFGLMARFAQPQSGRPFNIY